MLAQGARHMARTNWKATAWLVPALAASAGGGLAAETEALVFDYELPKQAFENADKLQYVPEHATQGKLAGKIVLHQAFAPNFFFFGGSNQGGKWDEYDQFVMDVFIEGGAAKASGF